MMSLNSRDEDTQLPYQSSGPILKSAAPHLLPSVFLEDHSLAASVEGHEGDRLHELMFSRASEATSSPHIQHGISQSLEPEETVVERSTARTFEPLFVVIEDPVTGHHHHPHVHYIFSDDDPELVTNAVLHSHGESLGQSYSKKRSLEKAGIPEALRERVVLLDLDESGQNVVVVQSLSQDWQIAAAGISAAPTFNNAARIEDNGLMLKIHGVERHDDEGGPSASRMMNNASHGADEALLHALNSFVSTFQEEQIILQKLLNAP